MNTKLYTNFTFLIIALITFPLVPVAAPPDTKVSICHIPAGNPTQGVIIKISPQAVQKHLEKHPGDHEVLEEGPFGSPSCSNGIDDDCNRLTDAADPKCQRNFKYVFTTNAEYIGNLGGLSGADTKCNQAVTDAANPLLVGAGHFTAWLSSSSTGAILRVPLGSAEYRLLNNTIVFSMGDTAPFTPSSAIDVNESGGTPGGTIRVWTGTDDAGLILLPNCQDWLAPSNSERGKYGLRSSTTSTWTDSGFAGLTCNDIVSNAAHLYCFED